MKKLVLFFFLVLSVSLFGQTPEYFKYQAVVRDAGGSILKAQNVSLRISILSGSTSGNIEYSEKHTKSTNDFGLVNLEIGNGNVVSGVFSNIDWSANTYFLKIDIDPNGGSTFSNIGTSQLLAVPYALHAKTVENDQVNDADADPSNEFQTLSKVGNSITLSNGGGNVIDEVDDGDSDDKNEIQTISKTGNAIVLSKNGGSITDEVDDADADPNNEIQTLTKTGNAIILSNSGGTVLDAVDDADADPTNEYQTISKTGSIVTLSNNGGTFTDDVNDADPNPTNEIQTISKTGNVITLSNNGGTIIDDNTDADADTTNEIQALSISGNVLTLSKNGGSVNLPSGGTGSYTAGTGIGISGTTINAQNTSNIWNANKIQNQDVTTTSPSTNGQILKWNQTTSQWELGTDNGTAYTAGNGISIVGTVISATGSGAPQTLSLSNDTLYISGGNNVVLNMDTTLWKLEGSQIISKLDTVGIGTDNPETLFEVVADQFTNAFIGDTTETIVATNFRKGSTAITGYHFDTSGTAIVGTNTTTNYFSLNYGSGGAFNGKYTGVYGTSLDTVQSVRGVIGVTESDHGDANGTEGYNYGSMGAGLYGYGQSTGITAYATGNGYYVPTGGMFANPNTTSYVALTYNNTDYKVYGNGTVSTIVDKPEGGKAVMFAPESPEILLTDYGTGKLVNGKAHIDIDPVFANNIHVSEDHPLKVFVQLEGECNGVYVTNKTQYGFDVIELNKGESNVSFSYSIVANRSDRKRDNGTYSKHVGVRFPEAMEENRMKDNGQAIKNQIIKN
jgi:hypothetical protein